MKKTDCPALAATSDPGEYLTQDQPNNTPDDTEWECPCCGQPIPWQSLDWLRELPLLAARYADQYGVTPDLASTSLATLYGLYRFLRGCGG